MAERHLRDTIVTAAGLWEDVRICVPLMLLNHV
jgi:hypothetical protein